MEYIQLLAHSAKQLLVLGYTDDLQPIISGAPAFSNVLMDHFAFKSQMKKDDLLWCGVLFYFPQSTKESRHFSYKKDTLN